MRKLTAGALIAAATLLVSADGGAASCSVSSTVGVGFGAYNPLGADPLDSTGSVTYLCQSVGQGDTVAIELDAGQAGSFAPRRLASAGSQLEYNLFLDASRSVVWGDGFSGTSRYGPTAPPDGIQVTVPVYGRIFAGQRAAVPGAYSDTIVVTLVF